MNTEIYKNLEEYRDHLVVELWRVFHAQHAKRDAIEVPVEDLELWAQVTKHSAVQRRLQE